MRQLIFTSALSGIDRGRSGFCTVARHASLRERTVANLEKISGYESPGSTRPTVFLFRGYSGGNELLYILSRIADAGIDSFGRPNHIAHHLIFREDEIVQLLPPAEIALRFKGWRKEYKDEPLLFLEEDSIPPEIFREEKTTLLPAKRWEKLTGDSGNAALLCPRGEARATIFVGDETTTETVLGLWAESSEILGSRNAWDIAFSTGICSAQGNSRFLWRRVADHELAVRRCGDFILDFLAPLTALRAPKTEFSEYARTGKLLIRSSSKKEEIVHSNRVESSHLDESISVPVIKKKEESSEEIFKKRFSDIAGTLKFFGVSAIVIMSVLIIVLFFNPSDKEKREQRNAFTFRIPEKKKTPSVERFCSVLEEQIKLGDFAGAAEVWIAFSDNFPQDAERYGKKYLPRFKLKVVDAFAERIRRRLLAVDVGGTLSEEEKQLIRADLAMFHRVRQKLNFTDGVIQKRNLLLLKRAEVAVSNENFSEIK